MNDGYIMSAIFRCRQEIRNLQLIVHYTRQVTYAFN